MAKKANENSANWVDDPKAEQVLQKLGFKFVKAKFLIKDVDWKATETNVGRSGRPVSNDTVDDYAISLLDGDKFPRPVIVQLPSGVLVVGGVHRTKAAEEAGFKEVDCYIAEKRTDVEIRLLCIMLNRVEGVRVGKEESMAYAIHLVNEENMSQTQVSELLGLNKATVSNRVRADKLRRQAVAAGFKGQLNEGHWDKLSKLASNDKVLVSVAEHIKSHKITTTEVPNLVARVCAHKTEAQQLAFVETEGKSERAVEKATPVSPIILPTRTVFLRSFRALKKLVEAKKTLEDLQIVRDSDEHKLLKKEWSELKGLLTNALK